MALVPRLLGRQHRVPCVLVYQHSHRTYSSSFLSSLKQVFNRTVETPLPKTVNDVQTHHGYLRNDKFSWLENPQDTSLTHYIQAENSYTAKEFSKHTWLKRCVQKEMKRKLYTNKQLPPLKTVAHGYEYYSTTSSHGMIYLRKPLGQGRNAPEQVLLNAGFLRSMNMSIRKVLLSPEHTIFAYNTEREGMEYGELHFKDLQDRPQWQNEVLEGVFNFVWANEETVYYTVTNAQLRPYRVYLHRIGTHQEEDVLVYEEKEDTVFVDITSTKDKKFITINCNSLSSSEARVIDATLKREQGQPPTLRRIKARVPGLEYYADHHGSTFYLLTNAHGATNFKLVRFPDTLIEDAVWEDVITMKETDKIEDVDLFQNFIVVYGRREGLPIILCYDVTTRTAHTVDLPEQFCVISPGTNLDFTTDSFRFSLSSPFTHESTYEYDMTHRQLKPIRIPHMQGFDKSEYICTQTHVNSHDNMSIPVTLIHKKSLSMDSKNPVLMRSYGAYGISTEPDFRIEHFPLLERGWVIALAHVRGGSELGRHWYEQGKLHNKINSFKDFISVAEHLVHTKVTSPSSMAAVGTSAGGLLVGAMLHMRPDLFKALVLKVPFVDPLSAMLNPNLPLTQVEYPEWGNPTLDKTTYEYIQDYSPYENVEHLKTTCPMPSVFITAGLKDQRVSYWQPLKLVARLRHALGKESSRRLFLKVDLDKGHFGSGVEQEARLAEAAEQVAFLVSQVQS